MHHCLKNGEAPADALVRSDGSFRFFHFPVAVRHIIIVGRGSEIVSAKAIDFNILPRIELEPIEVSGTCK